MKRLCGKIVHDLDLLRAEGDGPWEGTQGIGAQVQSKELPEQYGHVTAKIPVHHASSKERCISGTPDDAIEFLPRISAVIPVEVDDDQIPLPVDHHIADVIVTVLIGHGPTGQKVPVLREIFQKQVSPVILQGTGFVHGDFAVDLGIEEGFPIQRVFRCWYGMNLPKTASRILSIAVLYGGGIIRHDVLGICSVDPSVDDVNTFVTDSKFHGRAHGNVQSIYGLHGTKLTVPSVILFCR